MEPVTILALGGAAIALGTWLSRRAAKAAITSPWTPPDPPQDDSLVTAQDPRVSTGAHPLGVGVSSCPQNPPPPVGWRYWPNSAPVSANLGAWSVEIRNTYPIGTFAQQIVDGQLVGARIEYHTLQGATGARGCFKGLSLMLQIT